MDLNVSIYIGGVLKGNKTVSTPCLIGRSKEARLTVAHPAMSRKHCELYEDGGKLFLRDNSSLNGTLYKGDYVETPVELPLDSEFTVGELTFRVSPAEKIDVEERQEIADRPTAVIETLDEDGSDERPGAVTMIQSPNQEIPGTGTMTEPEKKDRQPKPPAIKPEEVSKKSGSKKIAPGDVRINIK